MNAVQDPASAKPVRDVTLPHVAIARGDTLRARVPAATVITIYNAGAAVVSRRGRPRSLDALKWRAAA